MSHFQLPDRTRLWTNRFSDEKIAIHLGNEIELEQWGSTDASGALPRIRLDKAGIVELRLIGRPTSSKPFTISIQKFRLKAVTPGTVILSGSNETGSMTSTPIKIVAGEFRNHKGMTRDLLADVGRRMLKARRVIAGHVKSGRPVLVGCAYEPRSSMLKEGHLQATRDGGHSVLIVGCNDAATEFLYVDPFPGGSNLKYEGGIAGDTYPPECFYLGVFKVNSFEAVLGRGPVLRKHADADGPWRGDRYLEVISGPKR